jgi:hypothetical protein
MEFLRLLDIVYRKTAEHNTLSSPVYSFQPDLNWKHYEKKPCQKVIPISHVVRSVTFAAHLSCTTVWMLAITRAIWDSEQARCTAFGLRFEIE